MNRRTETWESKKSRFGWCARVVWLALVGWVAGCSKGPPPAFQGYVEGDYIHVGSPIAGKLLDRPVRRGDTVGKGHPLFQLEHEAESASLTEAEARLAQSRARLDNLRKGRRPSEIASLDAGLSQARAARDLSRSEWSRRESLFRQAVLSVAELDQARSRRDADEALVIRLEAELETARLGGREDEIRAAETEVASTEAIVRRARWAVEQKSQVAPVAALVHDSLFEPGEYVPAGVPVVTLLPPGNVKVRFFVPQAELSRATPGVRVAIHVDGRPDPIVGIIRYVATEAEFTPPVIFSRENRQKLVFRVEAEPEAAAGQGLRPGQPVDVRWMVNPP